MGRTGIFEDFLEKKSISRNSLNRFNQVSLGIMNYKKNKIEKHYRKTNSFAARIFHARRNDGLDFLLLRKTLNYH